MQACKNIAKRSINAENNFINSVMEQFNFTKNEAEKILSVYKKHKLIKIDYVTGQFQLKMVGFGTNILWKMRWKNKKLLRSWKGSFSFRFPPNKITHSKYLKSKIIFIDNVVIIPYTIK